MKLRTKILAWLHVAPLALGALLAVLGLLVFGGGVLTSTLKPEHSQPWWLSEVVGLGAVAIGLLIVAFTLIYVLPWIFLLKMHAWAWWLLTVVYSLLTVLAVRAVAVNHLDRTFKAVNEYAQIVGYALVWAVTLLILLTDRPPWHARRRRRRRQ